MSTDYALLPEALEGSKKSVRPEASGQTTSAPFRTKALQIKIYRSKDVSFMLKKLDYILGINDTKALPTSYQFVSVVPGKFDCDKLGMILLHYCAN